MQTEDVTLKNINWKAMREKGVSLPDLIAGSLTRREGRPVKVSKVEPGDKRDHWLADWEYADGKPASAKCINDWCKQAQVEGRNPRKMCPLHEDMVDFLVAHLPNIELGDETRLMQSIKRAVQPQQRQPGEPMKPKLFVASADVALPGEAKFIQVKKAAEKAEEEKLEGKKRDGG